MWNNVVSEKRDEDVQFKIVTSLSNDKTDGKNNSNDPGAYAIYNVRFRWSWRRLRNTTNYITATNSSLQTSDIRQNTSQNLLTTEESSELSCKMHMGRG